MWGTFLGGMCVELCVGGGKYRLNIVTYRCTSTAMAVGVGNVGMWLYDRGMELKATRHADWLAM